MKVANQTLHFAFDSWVWINQVNNTSSVTRTAPKQNFAPLSLLRQWLNQVEINDQQLAHRLCKLIPAQCPFERDLKLWSKTLFHIPPLCKLNPVYEELVGLRFRALCYLADQCGEDITPYC